LRWARLRAAHLLAGLAVGTAFSVALALAGQSRLGGVHVGVLGLALNAAVCCLLAWRSDPDPAG